MTIRFLQYAAGFCLPAFCGRFLHLSNGFSPTDVFSYGIFQFSSVAQSRLTLCDPMNCSPPGFPVHHQLLELAQTHVCRVHVAIQHPILCCPLLLPPSIFPSIRVFSTESALHLIGAYTGGLQSLMTVTSCLPIWQVILHFSALCYSSLN